MALLLSKRRLSDGFTLSYTLFLALFFAALFSILTYFSFTNLKLSFKSYASLQAKYIAESANARALALMNTRTMPETDALDDDDDFDDDFGDIIDEDDDDSDEEEDADSDDDFEEDDFEDESILEIQPRYINYVSEDLFFVNIQTGEVINEEQYALLLAEQKNNQANRPLDYNEAEQLDIKDLYLPLPEVNVSYVGLIKIPEKSQLKPGFELKIADKIRVDIKQDNILDEYLGLSLRSSFDERKPVLRSISPNYAFPGDLVDIFVDGENLSSSKLNFSSSDFEIIDVSDDADVITVNLKEEIKSGTYTLNVSGKRIDFYVAPKFNPNKEAPELHNIFMEDDELGMKQMTEIENSGLIKGLKLTGRNLLVDNVPAILVPDIKGLRFEVKNFSEEEIIFDLEAKSLPVNNTFTIKLITSAGESNSWIVNIKAKASGDADLKPFTGIYSTRLKLLQANSISNLPWNFDDDFDEGLKRDGRPEDPAARDGEGRPEDSGQVGPQREFNLINSDLETVWLLESIATVNGYTYKESAIVRRTVPKIAAPLITNTGVRFSDKDFKIKGLELAKAELNDSVSKGETFLEFINEFPPLETDLDPDLDKVILDGSAVVEDLNLNDEALRFMSPEIVNFEKGALVSIVPSGNSFETVSDYAIIKEIQNEAIILESPGFKDIHFIRDNLVQFIPSVISTQSIDERSAKRHLMPDYAWLELENISGFQNLDNLLFSDISSLNYFKRDLKTQFPGSYIYALEDSARFQLEEYFDEGEYFGLNIIQGEVSFTKTNPLYGQGILIIDTTEGGRNPQGATVRIEGSSKNKSEFKGLIYVIGDLECSGTLEVQGAIIVKSPQDGTTIQINSEGFLNFNPLEIQKTLFDLPFLIQPGTRNIKRMKKHEFDAK